MRRVGRSSVKGTIVAVCSAVVLIGGGCSLQDSAPTTSMRIMSPSISTDQLPKAFTCDGQGISPSLVFQDVPEQAKSLALILDDPDVPRDVRPDGVWDHWLVWNIDPSRTSLDDGEAPGGTVGINSGGTVEYEPPCPPKGSHRYIFHAYALDSTVELQTGAGRLDLEKAMEGHILAEAQLITSYSRQ